ncbi:retrotransposon protein [Cucumis melo var. makuwa]|uniref:Retrotransposon protein n=1 Tax=Cucumis melo var. makuwa TaxID=1194695 RepID=A0A5D3C9T6_CUCMM|nr:retrotransposon protein [Cucumis melo var. makuwa]TYK08265.1 retrotransposon protein [Cucumis melo var. makuwa]
MQSSEKEIMGIKEMILSLKRSVEKLAKDVNNSLRQKKEPSTNDGSRLKMKGKADETELTSCLGGESVDKTEEEKVKVAVISFAPYEVDWFGWSNNRRKVTSWEDLKNRMFKHFLPTEKREFGSKIDKNQARRDLHRLFEEVLELFGTIAEDGLECIN